MSTPGGLEGQSQAYIASNFNDYMAKMLAHADNLQNAFQAKAHRKWYSSDWDLLTPSDLPDALLDRTELNTIYDRVTTSPTAGTLGDVIGTKLQIDYLAMADRALRARHATLPRSVAMAHGRRYGHSQGALFSDAPGGVQHAISNTIQAGSFTRPEQKDV